MHVQQPGRVPQLGLPRYADACLRRPLQPLSPCSPAILGERSSRGTLLGIPVAMLGVLLVAQPSFLFGTRGGGGIR